jgi:NAD(P)-dependent dehydrogenase (short-subunit alcohol dehydrogenase family)
MRRLENKVALITGTGGGQGRAAARRFAREGARIVGCDRKPAEDAETVRQVRDAGGEMVSQAPMNLSDEADVKAWIDFAVSEFGDFDILYNNASGARFGLVEDLSLDDWNYTLANELTLIFLAVKHALPVFKRKGGGCILNVASTAALSRGMPGGFAHGATKAGVLAMTRHLAVELAPLNIRVNAISPGSMDTPGVTSLTASPERQAVAARNLVPRFGTGDDTAAAAAYLCSDEAAWVTGVNIPIDGGGLAGSMPEARVSIDIKFN